MKFLLSFFLSLSILGVQAQSVKIVGTGSVSCSQYLSQSKNPISERDFLNWGQGYMSGLLMRAPSGVDENLDLLPPQYPLLKQLELLKNFCEKHTDKDFSEAVEELYKTLRMSNS